MRPTQVELAAACVGRESRVHFNQFRFFNLQLSFTVK